MSGDQNLHRRVDDLKDDFLTCKTEVGQELEKGNKRMNDLSTQIKEVSAAVELTNKNIETLLKIFSSAKGFWTFSGWIGKFIVRLAVVGASIAAIIYFIKTGDWK